MAELPGIALLLSEGSRSPLLGTDGEVNETDGFLILATIIFYTCILDPNEPWLLPSMSLSEGLPLH